MIPPASHDAGVGGLRGVIHVHSTISYDGQHSIGELARFFRARAMDFVCVTEHSDGLSAADMDRIVSESASVSDDSFLMVPGVEFSCRRRLHILGLGVATPIDSDDPIRVARHIRDAGGVAIVAHPLAYGTDYPEEMSEHVDGIEVWNITKDGWLAPGAEPLELWRQWRRRNADLRGFGALDLHSFDSPSRLWLELGASRLSMADILEALRRGDVTTRGDYLSVAGGAPPAGVDRWRLTGASRAYSALKGVRNGLAPVFARSKGRAR